MAAAAEEVAAVEQATSTAPESVSLKRKAGPGKSKQKRKKLKPVPMELRRAKPTPRMLKVFKKRARDYHSDSDAEEGTAGGAGLGTGDESDEPDEPEVADAKYEGDDDDEQLSDQEEDEGGDEGFDKFANGCRAFKAAFQKIMKTKISQDSLGPILAAHTKLVAAKLAEEMELPRVKGLSRKQKRLADEKRHEKLETYLNEKEAKLIKITMKGVVSLFNMVSKAQSSSITSKDIKSSSNRRRVEPHYSSKQENVAQSAVPEKSYDQPAWAPLQDSYMLSSKLKDWDKMEVSTTEVPQVDSMDSSDDE